MPWQVLSTQLTSIPTADHPKLEPRERCASFPEMCERAGLPRAHPSIQQVALVKRWTAPSGQTFQAGTLGLQHFNSSGAHVVFEGDFPLQDELKPADVAGDEPKADDAPPAPAPAAPRPPRAPKKPRAPRPPRAPRTK